MLVSPYSWLAEYTEPSRWLGGKSAGGPSSSDAVAALLQPDFVRRPSPRHRRLVGSDCGRVAAQELLERSQFPFLIREHARKYAWAVSECSVWRRR